MAGKECPECGAQTGELRYADRLVWLGCLLYVSVLGAAVLWGIVWASFYEDPTTSHTGFFGSYQFAGIVATLLVFSFATLVYRWSQFRVCSDCGHQWIQSPLDRGTVAPAPEA